MSTSIAIVTAVLLTAPAAPAVSAAPNAAAADDGHDGQPQSAIRFVNAARPTAPAVAAQETVKSPEPRNLASKVAWERRIADRATVEWAKPLSEPSDSGNDRNTLENSVLLRDGVPLRASAAPARGAPEIFVQGQPADELPTDSPFQDDPPAAPAEDGVPTDDAAPANEAAPADEAASSVAEQVPPGAIIGDYGFVGGAGVYDEMIYDEMPIDDGAYTSGLPYRKFPFPIHSPGNMPQHLQQKFKYSGYYYLRPYNWFQIREHQAEVANYGEDPRNPYANKVFAEVYREMHLGPHQADYLLDPEDGPSEDAQQ